MKTSEIIDKIFYIENWDIYYSVNMANNLFFDKEVTAFELSRAKWIHACLLKKRNIVINNLLHDCGYCFEYCYPKCERCPIGKTWLGVKCFFLNESNPLKVLKTIVKAHKKTGL